MNSPAYGLMLVLLLVLPFYPIAGDDQISRQHFENLYTQQLEVILYSARENRRLIARQQHVMQSLKMKMGQVKNILQDLPKKVAMEQSKRALGMGSNHLAFSCGRNRSPRNCVNILASSNATLDVRQTYLPCGLGWHHPMTASEVASAFILSEENQLLVQFVSTTWTKNKWKWMSGDAFLSSDSQYMCDMSSSISHPDNSCVVAKRRNDVFCLMPVSCMGHFRYACIHDSLSIKPMWK